MTEDKESEAKKDGAEAAPQAPVPPAAPVQNPMPSRQTGAATGDGPTADGGKETRVLAREMNFNEKITSGLAFASFLVALGALAVAYLTYQVMADTSDIKKAIGNLAALAAQTKRAADYGQGQVGALRDQVGALKDQVAEARKQTKAISDQTNAIKASSAATVKIATAEIETATAEIAAADSARKSADTVAASSAPRVVFIGVDLGPFDAAPDAKGQIEVAVTAHFSNVGGSAFHHGTGVFALVDKELPPKPNYAVPAAIPFGANELTIPPGGTLAPDAITYLFDPADAKAIKAGTEGLFAYGYIDYLDNAEQTHRVCFVDRIVRDSNGRMLYFPQRDAKAYIC